ncbi:acyl-ACP thioesterase domain-containing protein [Hoylesella oralis]|uniref:acyl-[acyl-carrier-protein] thioesterase n=1 Tax=Hoylesella oralis TaxID=28134 RepID=UPI0028E64903|nr:acyl-ACP thioesterase domain-containing protein [Hoylesella oralis]
MNQLLSKVGRYEFLAEPFHCDITYRLFIGHLGNHMLNAADFHSNDRGYGMSYLNPIHKTWVLSRLAIEMEEMPMAYDKFFVETWIESAMKYFTGRNFSILGTDERVYGYGRSVWAMIDTETRQPTDILSVRDGLIKEYIETEKDCPIRKSSRVKINEHTPLIRTISTGYSDVDINGHINSVKYIEHILDLWDIDWYREYRPQRFEIAYVAEAHCGDRLCFYREQEQQNEYNIRITKLVQDEEKEEVEVCRSKIKFIRN